MIALQWLGTLTSTFSVRFLTQYNFQALAASGLTYRTFLIVLLCLNGMQFAQGVLIAQQKQNVAFIRAMFWLILLLSFILALGVLCVPTILMWNHQPIHLVRLTIPYFTWLAVCCPLMALNGLWQQCFLVFQKPIWILYIAVTYFVVALAGNYLFILGWHHVHGFGLAGSSIAEYVAQSVILLLTLLSATRLPKLSVKYLFTISKNIFAGWGQALKVGWPICLRWLNEMLAIAVIAILIGHLGSLALGSFRLVSQLDLLVLMIPYSMNIILAILLAEPNKRFIDLKIFNIALWTTITLLLIASIFFWFTPKGLLVHIYSVNPKQHALLHLSIQLLMITAVGQLFNGARQICNAALRSKQDTFWPFIYSVICYWGITVFGSWIAIHYYHQGVLCIWLLFNVMYIVLCTLSAFRLVYLCRKEK